MMDAKSQKQHQLVELTKRSIMASHHNWNRVGEKIRKRKLIPHGWSFLADVFWPMLGEEGCEERSEISQTHPTSLQPSILIGGE